MGDLSPVHRLADAAATTAALRSKWDGVARDAPSARHHLLDSVAEEDEDKHHDGDMRAAGEFDSLATIAEASPEPESVPLSNGDNARTPCAATERHALQADSQASLVEIATECDGSDAGEPAPRMVGTGTFYERQLTFDGIDSIYEIVEVLVPADDSDDGAAQRASAGRPRRKFRWWWSRKEAQDSVITL
ncbi:hypothetical protein HK105_204305 [Polyrhizophydium stewartii]|uniref:Uncharacterized protein n=1 Tax=Polyrhizophydium stewartii TaxID=2732419 RepID=A0ABR4N9T0_9FUNG